MDRYDYLIVSLLTLLVCVAVLGLLFLGLWALPLTEEVPGPCPTTGAAP